MLRWITKMAATLNPKGRILKGSRTTPVPKVNRSPNQQNNASISTYGPAGRLIDSFSSETLLSGRPKIPNLRDNSRSGGGVSRPYSANHRPIAIKHLEDVAAYLNTEQAKRVVIVAGAGISTPSGIPDFRSPGTGLYDNLQQYNIPYPEAIFDIDYFNYNPRPFFTLAKELYPSGRYRPNYLHYFARLLNDRGILLRMYTQNIDGLERIAGLPPEKLVEAHGTFATATCISCRRKYDGDEIKDSILANKLPICKTTSCSGVIKPDIVFFGEELPKHFYFYLKDMLQTDLVLIMGTSLEVQPFAGIIDTVRFTVPRVLFNREAVGPFRKQRRPKDFVSEGDLIEKMQEFVEMSGWKDDMIALVTRMEGVFKTAFPPPVSPSKIDGNRKASKARPDQLAAMWRRNAPMNEYSESDDSSDTESVPASSEDSDTSTSEEEIKARVLGGINKNSQESSVRLRSKNAKALKLSSNSGISVHDTGLHKSKQAEMKHINENTRVNCGDSANGKLLSSKTGSHSLEISGGLGWAVSIDSKGRRHYSQHAESHIGADLHRKLRLLSLREKKDEKDERTKSNVIATKLAPIDRKPPMAPRKPLHQKNEASQSTHTTHQGKPRSKSVNKVASGKVTCSATADFKFTHPRIKSAVPDLLAYHCTHGSKAAPFNTRMLVANEALTDSSSSDDDDGDGSDRDSDDSSDDSR